MTIGWTLSDKYGSYRKHGNCLQLLFIVVLKCQIFASRKDARIQDGLRYQYEPFLPAPPFDVEFSAFLATSLSQV